MAKVSTEQDIAGAIIQIGSTPQRFVRLGVTRDVVLTEGAIIAPHRHGSTSIVGATFVKPGFFVQIEGPKSDGSGGTEWYSVVVAGDVATCGHSVSGSGFVEIG